MSFWDDFVDGFTTAIVDVGTSATRIVTDTAIDLGNVATGFQFSDDMEAAKQTLSDVGILSAADAIRKNHYPFLDEMENTARAKHAEITRLYDQAQKTERSRDQASEQLNKRLDGLKLLAQMSLDAEKLYAEAAQFPYWQNWANQVGFERTTLANLQNAAPEWETICQNLLISQGVTNIAEGVTGIIGSLATVGKTASLLKLSRTTNMTLGQASKSAGQMVGRLAKIGRIAGRASAVLAVVSIGLDVGLTIAQLEEQKNTLQENIDDLNEGISLARQDITELNQETSEIQQATAKLLATLKPPMTTDWASWLEEQRSKVTAARNALQSFLYAREKALEAAKATSGVLSPEKRINVLRAIDSRITAEIAQQIIAEADGHPVSGVSGYMRKA